MYSSINPNSSPSTLWLAIIHDVLSLPPSLNYVPVGPPIVSPFLYSSYGEQHNDEIMKIFGLVQTMDVPILMGDFNHGPAIQG